MCGICGLTYADFRLPERARLRRMNEAIFHRGPDSEGMYLSEGAGLAMRRLAIIDLKSGDQPMTNEDKTIWIVFNGEIYNFRALRRELEARGHRFRTESDTECIVHLYEERGASCVEALRGQFAFAIWDTRRRSLLLARDRLGQKPLYYAEQEGAFFFSSELPGLLEGLPSRPEVSLPSVDLYLSLQYIPDPFTAYRGVFKLPPAHTLTWRAGKLDISRYWTPAFLPKFDDSQEELEARAREILRESVRLRMISDVPLGAHLSGGIDSSIVVALMAEESSQPVKTFSVGFEEQGFSELPYARAVAERYATDHHEFILSFGDVPATAEMLARHFGEPFADPSALPLYLLSKITREHVTVALNGDGGDDFLAGYPRYWLDPLADAYLRLPRAWTETFVPRLLHFLPDTASRPVGHSFSNGLKRLRQLTEVDSRASILRWSSYFTPSQRRRLWRQEVWEEISPDAAEAWLVSRFEELKGAGRLDKTLFCDVQTYLPGDLLVKADRMTMAASLEGRSPFLDHHWAEFASCLPENMKLRGRRGKYLLRRAFESYLPKEVLSHRKQGFGIPVGAWFRGPLAGWAREELLGFDNPLQAWFNPSALETILDEHRTGRENHGKRIWALVMLALWMKRTQ